MPESGAARPAEGDAQTDEELVDQIIGGRTLLFEVLMRRHNERVYRLARSIVRDDGEAEDVMQQGRAVRE
jgi:RNA polymerase sigma-70 factor (ECF subfamily)